MSHWLYGSYRWKQVRRYVLGRDLHVCRVNGTGCTRQAIDVHHLERPEERPDLAFNPNNLVSVCRKCHAQVTIIAAAERITRDVGPSRLW